MRGMAWFVVPFYRLIESFFTAFRMTITEGFRQSDKKAAWATLRQAQGFQQVAHPTELNPSLTVAARLDRSFSVVLDDTV